MVDRNSSPEPPPDARIAALAARQHGLVTTVQLRDLGFAPPAIAYRLRAARLHAVHRGVYAVGHRASDPDARLHAAVLAVGGDAVLSHVSAAVLWGLIDREFVAARCPVDVATVRRLRQRRGIRIHVAGALRGETTRLRGIPVTRPARTLADLAGAVPAATLRRAVRVAEVRRLVDPPALQTQLRRRRRGAPRLRALIGDGPAPTRSELEDRTLRLLRRHGFPRPLINATVRASGHGYEVDFLFADRRVVLEADGERYHASRLAWQADAAKQAALEAAGYRVVRVTWAQITRNAPQTVARLRRVIPAAAPA